LEYVERGDVDPSLIATHRVSLDEALGAYRLLKNKDQGCVRVVLRP
jgi:threonine dehydrogenase-like Zn-dependent dehydrogenase